MDNGGRGATTEIKKPDGIHASYFFNLYDNDFLSEVYLRLLNRPLDSTGAGSYLALIRQGKSRYVILDNIIRSSEAKSVGVRLYGMAPYRCMRVVWAIPIIGRTVAALSLLLNAGKLMDDLRALENQLYILSKHKDQSPDNMKISYHDEDVT